MTGGGNGGRGGITVATGVALLALISIICSLAPMVQGETLIGVFDAQNGVVMAQSLAMDKWQGKQNAVQTLFSTFDESEMSWLFPALERVWAGRKIPMITLEPKFWQKASPTDIEIQVARGNFDGYLTTWGQSLRNFLAGPDGTLGTADDRRAYFRFAHEMNGNWYPWSATQGQSSPSDYVAMWRHVYNLFASDAVGLTRAQCANSLLWVWSPIDFDVGDFKMEDYYPGDSFVDWVGITGFNWGTSESWSGWWDPTRLYADAIDRVREIGGGKKPVAITEYSSVPQGGDKAVWLSQFFDLIEQKDVRMVCYFNLDKSEGNGGLKQWAIFGGSTGNSDFWDPESTTNYRGWTNYRDAIRGNDNIIGGDPKNSRVITDVAFRGWMGKAPTTRPEKGSEDDSEDGSNTIPLAPPVKTNVKLLQVIGEGTLHRYDFMAWGSDDTLANPTFNPSDNFALQPAEGNTLLRVRSTGWGGCGMFVKESNKGASVSLAAFKRLRFSIANTAPIRIEIQDANGQKWGQIVKPSSDLVWRRVTLTLSRRSINGATIDFSKVTGLFLATADSETDFYIDNVTFER